MRRITLLGALAEHADLSRDVLLEHLAGIANTPGEEPHELVTVNASPDIWHLLAQSTNDTCRDAAARTVLTPTDDLRALLGDPNAQIRTHARRRLGEIQGINNRLINRDDLPGDEHIDKLVDSLDEVIWTHGILTTDSVQPALEHFVTHLTLDTPDTFEPVDGSYAETYFHLGRIIPVIGWDNLDRMNVSPTQRLILAAISANESPNIHDSARSAATHYQHLITSDTIDQITSTALAAMPLSNRSVEVLTMLLNLCALSPEATASQLDDITMGLDRFDTAACFAASHPNARPELTGHVLDQLVHDHHMPCRWRITGTPASEHEQAARMWGQDSSESARWYLDHFHNLQADSLIKLANEHVDWTQESWVRRWVMAAANSLDRRHITQLNINALAHLAQSAHDHLMVHYCGPDSLETLAAQHLAGLLDPVLARYPNGVHLLTHLAQLPDTPEELEALLGGIHQDQRRVTSPARRSSDTAGHYESR